MIWEPPSTLEIPFSASADCDSWTTKTVLVTAPLSCKELEFPHDILRNMAQVNDNNISFLHQASHTARHPASQHVIGNSLV